MKVNDFIKTATDFANVQTCYLRGGIGKYLDEAWYKSLLAKCPENAKYGNGENGHYVNTNAFAFDCICFIKAILAGCTPSHYLKDYAEYNKCSIGDCTTKEFKAMLCDKVQPASAPAGYGLATDGHAGISLGGGKWIDCNWNGTTQNGVKIHTSGIGAFDTAGKIPTIDYSASPAETEKEILTNFANWLINQYVTR